VVQEQYTANPPSYDWSDKGFAKGMFVIILWRKNHFSLLDIDLLAYCVVLEFSQQALQNWLYYLLSTMTDNISELCMFQDMRMRSSVLYFANQ
jgi:hypothetical protein